MSFHPVRARPIAALPAQAEEAPASEVNDIAAATTTEPPTRRHTIIQACDRCRQRKAKCNGQRPQCGRCRHSDVECNYTTMRDRATVLKQENARLEVKVKTLEHARDSSIGTTDPFILLNSEFTRLEARVKTLESELQQLKQVNSAPPTTPPH